MAIADGALPQLKGLALGSSATTDAGITALVTSSSTPHLHALYGMYLDKVTEKSVRLLMSVARFNEVYPQFAG